MITFLCCPPSHDQWSPPGPPPASPREAGGPPQDLPDPANPPVLLATRTLSCSALRPGGSATTAQPAQTGTGLAAGARTCAAPPPGSVGSRSEVAGIAASRHTEARHAIHLVLLVTIRRILTETRRARSRGSRTTAPSGTLAGMADGFRHRKAASGRHTGFLDSHVLTESPNGMNGALPM